MSLCPYLATTASLKHGFEMSDGRFKVLGHLLSPQRTAIARMPRSKAYSWGFEFDAFENLEGGHLRSENRMRTQSS